jgi:hypothetical protein
MWLVIQEEGDHWWRLVGDESQSKEDDEVNLFKELDSVPPFDSTLVL